MSLKERVEASIAKHKEEDDFLEEVCNEIDRLQEWRTRFDSFITKAERWTRGEIDERTLKNYIREARTLLAEKPE